jgi:hypothetical protein
MQYRYAGFVLMAAVVVLRCGTSRAIGQERRPEPN